MAQDATTGPHYSRWSTLPNLITVVRLLLVPVFLLSLMSWECCDAGPRWLTAAIFLFASATDLLDGSLARRRNEVSSFGIIADPIADKALTGAALIGLSVLGELAWWVTIAILAREIGITVLRFWIMRVGIIAAGRGGKTKTALQMTAITMYLLSLPPPLDVLSEVVMLAAVVMTVATGVHYIAQALKMHREIRS
jgi:CDP-diacylglycerol---glycerol-3-phosphate 3-phosphatidyltransferase